MVKCFLRIDYLKYTASGIIKFLPKDRTKGVYILQRRVSLNNRSIQV
jgi:hypothetical protein